MATKVNEKLEISLMDGTKFDAKPLKISLLKPFMKKFAELGAVAEDNEKSMDIMMDCVQIAMQQFAPALAADKKLIEENIDLPTVYKVIEAASGIQLADVADVLASSK